MIIHGDCLDFLKMMVPKGAGSGAGKEGKIPPVKAMFIDPPDNIGLKYGKYDDQMKDEDYYNWIYRLITESLLRCDIFWISYNIKHDLEIKSIVRDIIKYRHPSWSVKTIIWAYTFGQYNDKDFGGGYRPIIRMMKAGAKGYIDGLREVSERQKLGDKRAAGDRVPTDVWHIPRIVGNSWQRCEWHPTQHPIELMDKVVRYSVQGEEVIVDLCAGTGSMLRAWKAIKGTGAGKGRAWGVEIDGEYCKKIAEMNGMEIKELEADSGITIL